MWVILRLLLPHGDFIARRMDKNKTWSNTNRGVQDADDVLFRQWLTHWTMGEVAVIFKLIIQNNILSTISEIALGRMSQMFTNEKSVLV